MEETIQIKPSKELAYWVGVAQSDGCLCTYKEYGRKEPSVIYLWVYQKALYQC